MPYVICPDCATTAYTAARFTTVDHCPVCDAQLPQMRVSAMLSMPQTPAMAAIRAERVLTGTASGASAP